MRSIFTKFAAVAAAAVLAACGKDQCDPGQEYKDNICKDVAKQPSKGTDTDAASPAPKTPDASTGGGNGDFGKTCATDDECKDTAVFCAVPPTGDPGYCTVKLDSCDQVQSMCPAGWSCLDLSKFQAGLPVICTKPSN